MAIVNAEASPSGGASRLSNQHGRVKHVLLSINEEVRSGVCASCGTVRIKRAGRKPSGKQQWRCLKGARPWSGVPSPGCRHRSSMNWRSLKGSECERCSFVAMHPGQLDLHHRDGDSSNNDAANLETVCANCHRLEHCWRPHDD